MGILIIGAVKPAVGEEDAQGSVGRKNLESAEQERGTGKTGTGGLEAVARRRSHCRPYWTLFEAERAQDRYCSVAGAGGSTYVAFVG